MNYEAENAQVLRGFVQDAERFLRTVPFISDEQFDALCCSECEGCEFFVKGELYPDSITHIGSPSEYDSKVLEIRPTEYMAIKGRICILEFLRQARPQLSSDIEHLIKEEAAVQEALAQ